VTKLESAIPGTAGRWKSVENDDEVKEVIIGVGIDQFSANVRDGSRSSPSWPMPAHARVPNAGSPLSMFRGTFFVGDTAEGLGPILADYSHVFFSSTSRTFLW